MERLTAYECWKKKEKEKLTDDQYKQLLLDNHIIVKKGTKLKIKSCKSPKFWYADKIGQLFDIIDGKTGPLGYLVFKGRLCDYYVNFDDAEIINE